MDSMRLLPAPRDDDSPCPAMDQSGMQPSSLVQVQSKKFLNLNWTNPQFFGTWTELAWTALDQSTQAESARICWESTNWLIHIYSYMQTHLAIHKSQCSSHPSPLATHHWYRMVGYLVVVLASSGGLVHSDCSQHVVVMKWHCVWVVAVVYSYSMYSS